MSDFNPLESQEAFLQYREGIKQRLQEHLTARLTFLQSAQQELSFLRNLAERANNKAVTAELSEVSQRVDKELSTLSTQTFSATPPAGSVPGLNLAPAEHAPFSVTNSADASAPERVQTPPAPVTVVRPTPPVPDFPPNPERPVEEIYQDTERLEKRAEEEDFTGTSGLVRLKALLCRQRGLQAELASRDMVYHPLRYLLGALRRQIEETHGAGHYLIPLRADIWPKDSWPWNRLADLYDNLASADEALDWYDDNADSLAETEREELLESIASHQTRLWRHLQAFFPRQNDEHQITLFRDLCDIAQDEGMYLYSLQERCPDATLNERAEQMPILLEQFAMDRQTREKREQVLEMIRTLVNAPDFGTEDNDAKALTEAVVQARALGCPASSKALRSLLEDWGSLLADSEEKSVQEVVREIQRERDRLATKSELEVPEEGRTLSETEQQELQSVREFVAGKRCLFIGGICREESRQKLERELGLAELIWPSTNGTESVYKFEADIQYTDITVILIRFMRTGWGQARELAVQHNKHFVRLPAGYGLMQVVRQFSRQLLHDDGRVAAKS